MAHRIEVLQTVHDGRVAELEAAIRAAAPSLRVLEVRDAYTVDAPLSAEQLERLGERLINPVSEAFTVNDSVVPENLSWAIETGSKPGVMDPVGESVERGLKRSISPLADDQHVYSSRLIILSGQATAQDMARVGEALTNPVIQRYHVKAGDDFRRQRGMDVLVPKVELTDKPSVSLVDFEVPDEELVLLGQRGIPGRVNGKLVYDESGELVRRGPLALDLDAMHAIQAYSRKIGRQLTDVEVESLAQTWSEHCKHTIFASPIDDIPEGIFQRYIRGATERIEQNLVAAGKKRFWGSVFSDNSGALVFDDNHYVAFKVETHNTPSALDPYGGSITGIVGVNRDPIGFGKGAKPTANVYYFCFSTPEDERVFYRGRNRTQPLLSSRRIMNGVIEGVKDGGNQSGIPTSLGRMLFDQRFRGKPLVFVGTDGLIPRIVNGEDSAYKKAMPGDYIVMVGGRVGIDGIHGATFSSVQLDSNSPSTAVQIGDPITQKRMSDAIVKEARDRGLYTSITDNGAGGLSCSVAEMAKESGGCRVELDRVPLKYAGLSPWQTWVSEAQERMTLSVPREKWDEFRELMERRGVEATVIGEFTDSGKCVVENAGEKVMDIDMEFLHNGVPLKHLSTVYTPARHKEPEPRSLEELTATFHSMLSRKNLASNAFISEQFDHEVQGGCVLKPLQGSGRVDAGASAYRPVLGSRRAVVKAQGILPQYSDIDTYDMAAASLDTAVRAVVAAGADPSKIGLLDNFCWCSSNEPERLGQLKRAAKACYDVAVAYSAPFISGKDSMFNDFKGFDENGAPVKISVPPTLLVTAASVADDAAQLVSLDAKQAGDLVYVLGQTRAELGASEYYAMLGEKERGEAYIGNQVPIVDPRRNLKLYHAYHAAVRQGLVASGQSVERGGLALALAKTAMGGEKGMELELTELGADKLRLDEVLFSESQGRIVVTVAPQNRSSFEKAMEGNAYAMIGAVTDSKAFVASIKAKRVVDTTIDEMLSYSRSTFEGY